MGLQYLLPKLKHQSNEKDVLDQPLFIDIVTKDEENGGWNSDVRSLGNLRKNQDQEQGGNLLQSYSKKLKRYCFTF